VVVLAVVSVLVGVATGTAGVGAGGAPYVNACIVIDAVTVFPAGARLTVSTLKRRPFASSEPSCT